MKRQYLIKKNLPDSPGVYFFKKGRTILYIGKATSLRDRVKSYFSNDLFKTRGVLLVDMVTQATTLDFIKTDSVLEAFVLEVEQIKKHQPHFNTKEKDNKSFNYVVITKEDFPRVLVVRGRNLERDEVDFEYKYMFGPYPFGSELREALRLIRKIFPYRDTCTPCPELASVCKACFNRSIALCPGVCSGEMNKKEYGKQINHIRLFFQGKKAELMRALKKEMKQYAKEQKFELANEIKKTMSALMHIQDVSMMKRRDYSEASASGDEGSQFRMEAYDIAHLSGTDMIGAMTASMNGVFDKVSYRTFLIKSVDGANDTGALREIISRRLRHPEWQLPNMMIVDGGKAQFDAMKTAVNECAEVFGANDRTLPVVVAVVKDDRHKAREIIADAEHHALAQKYARDIISLNAECHRFAIGVHRRKRTASRGLNNSPRQKWTKGK